MKDFQLVSISAIARKTTVVILHTAQHASNTGKTEWVVTALRYYLASK